MRSAVATVLTLVLAGCGAIPEREPLLTDECRDLTAALDRAIIAETHFDPSLRRVAGLPLARTDRFLAGFEYEALAAEARDSWLDHAFERARGAYATEFARLDPETRAELQSTHRFDDLEARLSDCFAASVAPGSLPRSSYEVPDHYSHVQRALGLYPLTGLVARVFIARYRDDMTVRVQEGPATTFLHAQTWQAPDSDALPGDWLELPPATDALGVPRLTAEHWEALFQLHTPQLVSELRSEADRIGAPLLDHDGRIRIDTVRPTLFTYATYMRHRGRVLPQLNYAFWFPARTPERSLDLYAGDLAGILWRVTLDQRLRPVLYDSIHRCGCYHKLFVPPGSRVDLSGLAGERPLAFALDELPDPRHGLQLRLAAATHYIIQVRPAQPEPQALSYAMEPYERQFVLPGPDGAVSLFGPTGIVAQSRRPERFVLWPMGVPSPGAMRQRGMHATAFAGRRHFDDPDLLEALQLTFD